MYKKEIIKVIEIAESKGIRVRMIPNYISIGENKLVLEYEYNLPLLRVRPEPLEDVNNYLLKRFFDVIISGVLLFTIFPILFIIIYPLIKLSSRGPALFKQKENWSIK